jgi:hypothetical protein
LEKNMKITPQIRRSTTALVTAMSLLALTACGQTKEDRAASGALIGAGTGAVVGAAVAGSPAGGALVGGAIGAGAGAAAGALTDPSKIDLGKPIWK